jgi:hypothetical protein
VRLGTLTRAAARFLDAAVVAGLNILVAGGTQAGNPATSQTPVSSLNGWAHGVAVCEAWAHGIV